MPEQVTAEQLHARFTDRQAQTAFYEQLMDRVLSTIVPFAQKRTPRLTGATQESEAYRVERGGRKGFLTAGTVYSPFVHARVPFFNQGVGDARSDTAQVLADSGTDYFEAVIE